jgi:hypothetical protein
MLLSNEFFCLKNKATQTKHVFDKILKENSWVRKFIFLLKIYIFLFILNWYSFSKNNSIFVAFYSMNSIAIKKKQILLSQKKYK